MNILIVDDDKEIVKYFKKFLLKKDVSVDIAYDGRKALLLLKKYDYDIAFFDENMPELTGLELVEFCKKEKKKVKTVIVSGYHLLNESFVESVGADEYLKKPCDLKDIEAILKKYSIEKN